MLWVSSNQETPKPPTQEKINRINILIFMEASISVNLNIGSDFNLLKKIICANRTEYTTVKLVAAIVRKKVHKFISLIISNSKIRSLEKKPVKKGTPQRLKLATKKILIENGKFETPLPKARKS